MFDRLLYMICVVLNEYGLGGIVLFIQEQKEATR